MNISWTDSIREWFLISWVCRSDTLLSRCFPVQCRLRETCIFSSALYRLIFRPAYKHFHYKKKMVSVLKQFYFLHPWLLLGTLFWESPITSVDWKTRSGNTGKNVWQTFMLIAEIFHTGGRNTNKVKQHTKGYLLGFLEQKGNDTQQRVFELVNEQIQLAIFHNLLLNHIII